VCPALTNPCEYFLDVIQSRSKSGQARVERLVNEYRRRLRDKWSKNTATGSDSQPSEQKRHTGIIIEDVTNLTESEVQASLRKLNLTPKKRRKLQLSSSRMPEIIDSKAPDEMKAAPAEVQRYAYRPSWCDQFVKLLRRSAITVCLPGCLSIVFCSCASFVTVLSKPIVDEGEACVGWYVKVCL
jgi:hypothetical protein